MMPAKDPDILRLGLQWCERNPAIIIGAAVTLFCTIAGIVGFELARHPPEQHIFIHFEQKSIP